MNAAGEASRRELLRTLQRLREQAAIEGNWGWFAVYDARIRFMTEEEEHGKTRR